MLRNLEDRFSRNVAHKTLVPGSGSTVLQAGRHTFPFVYQLPPNLPSSYESHIGNVRYQLKGTIDKPWKFDHHTKKLFTIISGLDLNTQPSAPVS